MNKYALKYKEACLDMAVEFVNGFFLDSDDDKDLVETPQEILERFVSWDPTGILELCDMYLSISDIYDFYRYGATYDQFCSWYWERIENGLKINLKNYLKKVLTKM